MQVRRAVSGDERALAVLHVRTWQEAYVGLIAQDHLDGLDARLVDRAARWRTTLATNEAPVVFVADGVRSGELDGFVSVAAARDNWAEEASGVGEVQAIYTRRRVWGSGLGTELWQAGTDHLVGEGFAEVVVWVLEDNLRARRFYESRGCSADGGVMTERIGGAEVTEVRYRGPVGG